MATTADCFGSRARKASRACHLCSTTKVRCTVEAGSSCQNCIRRGVKCVTDQRARRKRRVQTKLPGLIAKVPYQTWSVGVVPGNNYTLVPTPQSLAGQDAPVFSVGSPGSEWEMSPSPNPLQWAVNEITPPKSPEEEFWNTFTHLSSDQPSPCPCPCPDLSTTTLLPSYIKPLPPTMDTSTIEYLLSNGVFTFPSSSLQTALLQAFLECVYPSMPILEWQSFLNAINDQSGHGSISLLLYHAVMFSATTFVRLEHLLEEGYLNRREAQEACFQKVKPLYQTTYETDPVTAVQALLLMTYRVDTADGDDSRHWIKLAVSMASSIGILQDLPTTMGYQYNPKLWARIAWACHMTDCQIALRLRRRPIIQRAEFNHRMLTENDFDFGVLPAENQLVPSTCTIARNIEIQRELADICIANARLSLSISEVLRFRGKDDLSRAPNTPPTPESTLSDDPDLTTLVSTCEMGLAVWANSLPPTCHAQTLDLHDLNADPVILVQRSLLHMVFYTTVAILHQLQPFPSSKFCVKHAAHQITLVTSQLHKRNLQDRLPVIGVTATLVALIIHISELKAPPSIETNEAVGNFRSCVDVMASLRDVYWEAQTVTAWAFGTIEKIGLAGGF